MGGVWTRCPTRASSGFGGPETRGWGFLWGGMGSEGPPKTPRARSFRRAARVQRGYLTRTSPLTAKWAPVPGNPHPHRAAAALHHSTYRLPWRTKQDQLPSLASAHRNPLLITLSLQRLYYTYIYSASTASTSSQNWHSYEYIHPYPARLLALTHSLTHSLPDTPTPPLPPLPSPHSKSNRHRPLISHLMPPSSAPPRLLWVFRSSQVLYII